MTAPTWSIRCILTFLAILALQGVSFGQSLYDVVISLSDRQRVVNQRDQVNTYLKNQNNNPDDRDSELPGDEPINWLGVGTAPTQSVVDGLDIGGKIALLNQAIAEFDRLKFAFINSSPGEFEPGATVGTLKSHTFGDFDPLPRATPEKYNELLRMLAQRVRTLHLIRWPVGFRVRTLFDVSNVFNTVAYNDPNDDNHDGNRLPYVETRAYVGNKEVVVESVAWKPDSIGPNNLDRRISTPFVNVNYHISSSLDVN